MAVFLRSTAKKIIVLFAIGIILLVASSSASAELIQVILKDRAVSTKIKVDGRTRVLTVGSGLPWRAIPRSGYVSVDGRSYRGSVLVKKFGGRMRVVNELDMEEYLKGVVPSEMPSDFPEEALKAQAVAARTYAWYRRTQSGYSGLLPTVSDQVYRGVWAETDTTNRAVDATAGEMLHLGSSVIPAYFHSTCGGVSERASSVWPPTRENPRDQTWLAVDRAVFTPVRDSLASDGAANCSASPHFNWTARFTKVQLSNALKKISARRGLESIRVASRGESGRVAEFEAVFHGADGIAIPIAVNGPRFRMAIGPNRLKSLLCDVTHEGDYFVFRGNGWGHGVGLCQWGARGMAESGHDYRSILRKYYNGAELAGSNRPLEWPILMDVVM